MKAYMSDASRRFDALGDFGPAAEREARRILAETEPDGPQTALFGIERIAARNCAPNEWTGALADALRAFVGVDNA